MIVALGVLTVTMLLTGAALLTVGGDASLTRADLDGKRAYAAAQSGLQAYLYQLNNNASTSSWWETCSNDLTNGNGTAVAVPGSTTGVTYSYRPVPVGSYTSCSTTDPVGSLISASTGTLRMRVTGYSGSQSRTIVASFRTLTPLAFLWYTKYETMDTSLVPNGSNCDRFYWQTNPAPSGACYIYWVSGDHMNGPMYTQDQYLIQTGNTPTWGRNAQDVIASQVPTTGQNDICVNSNCQNDPNILGTAKPDVTPQVPLPSDNSNLQTDASAHGQVFAGTTTLTLSINSSGKTVANGFTCATATTCTQIQNLDLSSNPILYAANTSGCTSPTYTPTSIQYSTITPSNGSTTWSGQSAYAGQCGDIYVSGTYNTPLTIGAGNNIIVTGNLENSTDTDGQTSPTGTATMGLVANQYVRVMHPCTGSSPSQPANVTIDAAILTLSHSFFVDNYSCGRESRPGTLTVHGAIAQYFRGAVGTTGGSGSGTGYLKNYNYDDRLSLLLPPYLFDLQNTQWTVYRETLCSTVSSGSNTCGS